MKRRAFTLIELLVVIAVIAVLMGILMPALSRAREQGKRAMCMAHLKQMQLAWVMYSDENDGRLVNGDADEYGDLGGFHTNERPWVMKDWNRRSEPALSLTVKEKQIKAGALWPYISNLKAYHCPTGTIAKTELRMFSFMDSMNVKDWTKTGDAVGPYGKAYKKRSNIKEGARRMCLVDDGGTGGKTQGGWTVYTNVSQWWDPIPYRHGKGTTVAYVDGHVEHFKYGDSRTLELAELSDGDPEAALSSQYIRVDAGAGNQDNLKYRVGVWGSRAASGRGI